MLAILLLCASAWASHPKLGTGPVQCRHNSDCYKAREPLEWYRKGQDGQIDYGDTGCFCDHYAQTCKISGAGQDGHHPIQTDCVYCGRKCDKTEVFYDLIAQKHGYGHPKPQFHHDPRPSYGKPPPTPGYGHPKPKPTPGYEHPKPKPTPGYGHPKPEPQPSYHRQTPAYRSYPTPAPKPTYVARPAPRYPPQPRYARPTPGYPKNNGYAKKTPATTRGYPTPPRYPPQPRYEKPTTPAHQPRPSYPTHPPRPTYQPRYPEPSTPAPPPTYNSKPKHSGYPPQPRYSPKPTQGSRYPPRNAYQPPTTTPAYPPRPAYGRKTPAPNRYETQQQRQDVILSQSGYGDPYAILKPPYYG